MHLIRRVISLFIWIAFFSLGTQMVSQLISGKSAGMLTVVLVVFISLVSLFILKIVDEHSYTKHRPIILEVFRKENRLMTGREVRKVLLYGLGIYSKLRRMEEEGYLTAKIAEQLTENSVDEIVRYELTEKGRSFLSQHQTAPI